MRRIGQSPTTEQIRSGRRAADNWFETAGNRFNVYRGTSDPIASEIPLNQWIVHYNTTTTTLAIWANVDGVVKKLLDSDHVILTET